MTDSSFTLADVVVGRSRMMGRSTAGHMVSGVVLAVVPGVCFRVDGGAQISLLWRELKLLAAETVDAVSEVGAEDADDDAEDADDEDDEAVDAPPPVPVRRTDSGADYGFDGYPDCEFWERQGVEPVFVATPAHYSGGDVDADRVGELLEYGRIAAETQGGAYLRAWQRQMDSLAPSTPRRLRTVECPGAPVRPKRDLSFHRGRGILAGDFIKPDPAATRSETRRYLLDEMERWLGEDSRIREHALEIVAAGLTVADVDDEVQRGTWPAARLFVLLTALQTLLHKTFPKEGRPIDHVARWVMRTIRRCVEEDEDEGPLEAAAMEFWRTDLLGDATIDSFWDASPFDALREAPVLSDVDEDDITFVEFLTKEYTVAYPGWAPLAICFAAVSYLWSVAFAIGMCKSNSC